MEIILVLNNKLFMHDTQLGSFHDEEVLAMCQLSSLKENNMVISNDNLPYCDYFGDIFTYLNMSVGSAERGFTENNIMQILRGNPTYDKGTQKNFAWFIRFEYAFRQQEVLNKRELIKSVEENNV